MIFDWLLLSATIIFFLFLMIMLFYYKSLAVRNKTRYAAMKVSLNEAEILIRKYHMQLQRSIGNMDMLSEELSNIKLELQTHKQRASQAKFENEKLRRRVYELEQKIDALI